MKTKVVKNKFLDRNFYSMLYGGTISIIIVAILVMSDSIVAGLFLGIDAVSGVSIITPLYSLTAFFASILYIGMPIMYSTAVGKADMDEAHSIFNSGAFYTILIGVVFFILVSLFGDLYIKFLNVTDAIGDEALAYLKWMKFVILVMPFNYYFSEMVYADGDSATVAVQSIVQAVFNVTLSIYLSKKVGLAGISFASFMSNILSLLILSTHLLRDSNSLKFKIQRKLINIFSILEYGIVDASIYLFDFIFFIVFNKFVIANFGVEKISYVIIIMFIKEFTLVFDGVGNAITPMMSIYFSEKNYEGVKGIWEKARRTAIVEGLVAMIFIVLISNFVFDIYNIYDASQRWTLFVGIFIISFSFVFISLLYLESSYLILVKKIKTAVIICAFRDIILSLPLCVILGYVFGDFATFIGISVGGILGYFFSKLYLIRKYGELNYPLMLKDVNNKSLIIAYDVKPAEIVKTRDYIEARLREAKLSQKTINRALLLFEECSMQIYAENEGKDIVGEASIVLGDKLILIIRDSGKIMNVIDYDADVTSIEKYIASNLFLSMSSTSKNMIAMSYNRNIFEIDVSDN